MAAGRRGILGVAVSVDHVPVDDVPRRGATFCPVAGAAEAVGTARRGGGMAYASSRPSHHDGFAMFPTKHDRLVDARTPYGGDIVGEFVEAMRAEGLRVGLYYSLSDWHHPTTRRSPTTTGRTGFIAYRRPEPDAWARYLDVPVRSGRASC